MRRGDLDLLQLRAPGLRLFPTRRLTGHLLEEAEHASGVIVKLVEFDARLFVVQRQGEDADEVTTADLRTRAITSLTWLGELDPSVGGCVGRGDEACNPCHPLILARMRAGDAGRNGVGGAIAGDAAGSRRRVAPSRRRGCIAAIGGERVAAVQAFLRWVVAVLVLCAVVVPAIPLLVVYFADANNTGGNSAVEVFTLVFPAAAAALLVYAALVVANPAGFPTGSRSRFVLPVPFVVLAAVPLLVISFATLATKGYFPPSGAF